MRPAPTSAHQSDPEEELYVSEPAKMFRSIPVTPYNCRVESSVLKRIPHTLCVVTSPALRRRLKRSLHGTGSTVEFCDSVEQAEKCSQPPNLLFLDQESRQDSQLPHLLQVMDKQGKVVIIGESIEDNDFVQLMRQQPFDNVMDASEPDENEIVVTSVKLLTGDIFGLDKYLSWGADLHVGQVSNYDDKRAAIEQVASFARESGARRKILGRIENVTDELLMNAIYNAPAAAKAGATGQDNLKFSVGDNQVLDADSKAATLTYACDGRYFGVSVVDYYGELRKQSILDNLLRARERGGRPRAGTSGAGLGIFFVLASASRYIANIQQGVKTEVICLFDMRLTGRETQTCTSSLHIFTADGTKPG